MAAAADVGVDACEFLMRHNVAGMMQALGAMAAGNLVPLGRFAEAWELLRRTLSVRPTGSPALLAHLYALQISLRQGDLDEAARHHQRLQELCPDPAGLVGWEFPLVLAEYENATGSLWAAVGILERSLQEYGDADPKFSAQMAMQGARTSADLAVAARDHHDAGAEAAARAALHRFHGAHAAVAGALGEYRPDPRLDAHLTVLDAESERCLGGSRQQPLWEVAVTALDRAGCAYDAVQARVRLAECLLQRGERRGAARVLREAHRAAAAMGAAPAQRAIAGLATAARISLAEPEPPSAPSALLTPREQEVLTHLVAGRTYAEIATILFISEKTVSVHVSHLLHKTGTTNRVAAATWARRNGLAGTR